LIKDGELVNLTKEHVAKDEDEKRTVEQKGGFVFEKKLKEHKRYLVQGALEVTRSIGDRNYKKYITNTPDIVDYTLDKDD